MNDLNFCCSKDEWRKSGIECLEFLDWERIWYSQHKENKPIDKSNSSRSLNENSSQLALMKDIDIYNLIREYYTQRRFYFLDDSFQPLFANILVFLRNSNYSKALDALNLGTLLLLKQTQAEIKRLLKFLYLTANSTQAPRLVENVNYILYLIRLPNSFLNDTFNC